MIRAVAAALAVALLVGTATGADVLPGSRIAITGPLGVAVLDDMAAGTSRTVYTVTDGETPDIFELVLSEPLAPDFRSGAVVIVTGVARSAHLLEVESIAIQPDTGLGSASVLRDGSPTLVAGPRRALAVLVNFEDATLPCSPASVNDLLFNGPASVDQSFRAISYGNVSFSGDTVGPFKINAYRSQTCDVYGWASAADAAARAAGVSFSGYNHIIYVLADHPNYTCHWSGYGQIGGALTWIEGCEADHVYIHELGHNLGMEHASSDIGEAGGIVEYGDYSDPMGNGGRHVFFNAPHASQMGWLPSEKILSLTANGLIELASLDHVPSSTPLPMAITLAKLGTGSKYYLSYRRPVGADAQLSSLYADRLNVHRYAGGDARTYFVTALGDGDVFQPEPSAPLVTELAHDADSAIVEVAFSCALSPPLVTVAAATNEGRPGVAASLGIQVTNADNRKCGATTFDVSLAAQDGWSTSPPTAPLLLQPRASGAANLTVTPPASALNGSYPIEVTVRRHANPDDAVTLGRDFVVAKPVDYAVIALKVPKKVTLRAGKTITKTLAVTIQNRGPQSETLLDLAMLRGLVDVSVDSLGTCLTPTIDLVPPKSLPIVLRSKKKLTLKYLVRLTCANDGAATTKTALHDDYRYRATVQHQVVDGNVDVHAIDDTCPRGPLPTFFDPLPDGKITDQGCGTRTPSRLLGGPVSTDVVVK